MPQSDKMAAADKQQRRAGVAAKGEPQKALPRPAEARSWATNSKLLGGGKKAEARRKLPSGPLGGSGRKTNVSRSS